MRPVDDVLPVIICQCGDPLFIHVEVDSTPDFPRYRVQHGQNPEMVSPVFEGVIRSHDWRIQVHNYLNRGGQS